MDRIQKILSDRGVTSRRHAEEWITAGRVTCNGKVCVLGDKADPEKDVILLDGKPLPARQAYTYIMLNKPKGYVTTLSDEKGRKTVAELVQNCGRRVYPAGRLDMDSEGLLLLTDDGAMAQKLMHPSHQVNKTYRVWVRGYSEAGMEALKKPVVLDGYRIQPPILRLLDPKGVLEITIHEGRNRQVRRMCDMAGMPVVRLRRIREGGISLGSLPQGKWRHLTEEEIRCLFC